MFQTVQNQGEIMNARDFCFWLQGFFEMREDKTKPLTEWQMKMIQDHLNLMFKATVIQGTVTTTTGPSTAIAKAIDGLKLSEPLNVIC